MPILDVDRIKRGGQKFANGFTPGQKVLSVLAVAGLGLGLMTFTKWAATTDYAPLYSNLEPGDAAEVTDALAAINVKYELANGGATVMVPKDSVYQVRLDMASQGLPNGGDGWTAFDKNNGSITQSEFSRRVDYQRALQAEIANTVMAIEGVHAATVNITLPSDDPFVGAEESTAKAAVLLDLGSGTMSAESTQAVVHLVASSVADIAPDAVTVTDTHGNILAAPGQDDALASNQILARTSAYESAMASKIEGMLARSLGPGKATVVVTAEMNFDTTKETSSEVTPELGADGNPIPNRSITKDEEYSGPGGGSGGQLGIDGSIDAGSDTPVSYLNSESEQEVLADSVLRVTERAGGDVEKLSVAVLVDETAVPEGTAALTELISAAAGINPERDVVTVQSKKFDESVSKAVTAQLAGAESGASQDQLLGLIRYVVTLLIIGIVLFLAWRSVKKAQLSMGPVRVPLDLAELESSYGDYAQMDEITRTNEAINRLPSGPIKQLEPTRNPVEREITDLIDRQPDEVAQTLRSWLADRRA